jgi:glycosyltransferase involved in cell wall biosynthesis
MTNLFVLPYKNKYNLYLEMLYKPLRGAYAVQPFSFIKIFSALLRGQKTLVHIHWEENMYGSRYLAAAAWRLAYRFTLLLLAKLLGARVVWTMHNRASHDARHPALNRLARRLLGALAGRIIIQNKAEAAQYKKAVYIPHPNYVGVYGPQDPAGGAALRAELGVGEDEVLLLALGTIRPYKHLEALISATEAAKGPIRLLVAGKGDAPYIEDLKRRAGRGSRVIFKDGFVPDEAIPRYLAAADYCLFAYGGSSLTSGAVLLSLSYGTPVVALAMPAGEALQEGINGYASHTQEELVALLKHLPALPRLSRAQVVETVADASPERVAHEMQKLYTDIL